MKKFSADWIFPITEEPIKNGVIVVGEKGKILAIDRREQHDTASLDIRQGVIVPGFVNTHCHLELSHMKGKITTGTSLIPFITNVVRQRAAAAEVVQDAIEKAEQEMLANGIVAVGDISNVTDTFAQKSKGNLRYYTFVEMFDFLQDAVANTAFEQYKSVFEQLLTSHDGAQKSVVPHAPYSVSRALFAKINQENSLHKQLKTVSIHNQETVPENELFCHKSGEFINFYQKFGISLDAFEATQQTSIFYALKNLDSKQRNLFVHNTLTTADEITAAQQWSDRVFWATCPNANLYIENKLPNYRHFIDANAKMTIGTDSLTSNWQLSVLEEMKTISKYQNFVTTELLLRWATLNGAEALGFEADLGSLEVGKTPGLNLLTLLSEDLEITEKTTVRRIL